MENLGFAAADILIPASADMTKWSCVACDQYTSEPEYWRQVEGFVGDSLSTLRLMLPEAYLDDVNKRTEKIHATMREYVNGGVFREIKDSFVYVERTLHDGRVRYGLVGAIDLEIYDFSPSSRALCRPTEATVESRLPARVEIRKKAILEMPHIMMLLDDPQKTVIEQFSGIKDKLEKLYDFELMQQSGAVKGYRVNGDAAELVRSALKSLYDSQSGDNIMLYAMGDGNHSLAAAKVYYEQLKKTMGDAAKDHPARFALVELVNLHDDSLEFEPIHRVVYDVEPEKLISSLKSRCGEGKGDMQFTVVTVGGKRVMHVEKPTSSVTVGSVQDIIDDFTSKNGGSTDYIHGEDVVKALASSERRVGFIFGGISKDDFFEVIKNDGILPRKTFSMGHACDKRFYLECRTINK